MQNLENASFARHLCVGRMNGWSLVKYMNLRINVVDATQSLKGIKRIFMKVYNLYVTIMIVDIPKCRRLKAEMIAFLGLY